MIVIAQSNYPQIIELQRLLQYIANPSSPIEFIESELKPKIFDMRNKLNDPEKFNMTSDQIQAIIQNIESLIESVQSGNCQVFNKEMNQIKNKYFPENKSNIIKDQSQFITIQQIQQKIIYNYESNNFESNNFDIEIYDWEPYWKYIEPEGKDDMIYNILDRIDQQFPIEGMISKGFSAYGRTFVPYEDNIEIYDSDGHFMNSYNYDEIDDYVIELVNKNFVPDGHYEAEKIAELFIGTEQEELFSFLHNIADENENQHGVEDYRVQIGFAMIAMYSNYIGTESLKYDGQPAWAISQIQSDIMGKIKRIFDFMLNPIKEYPKILRGLLEIESFVFNHIDLFYQNPDRLWMKLKNLQKNEDSKLDIRYLFEYIR